MACAVLVRHDLLHCQRHVRLFKKLRMHLRLASPPQPWHCGVTGRPPLSTNVCIAGHAQETIEAIADPKGAPYITSHYAAAAVDCALCMSRIIRSISGTLALRRRLVMQVRSESGELRELRPRHTSRTAIIFRTHAV